MKSGFDISNEILWICKDCGGFSTAPYGKGIPECPACGGQTMRCTRITQREYDDLPSTERRKLVRLMRDPPSEENSAYRNMLYVCRACGTLSSSKQLNGRAVCPACGKKRMSCLMMPPTEYNELSQEERAELIQGICPQADEDEPDRENPNGDDAPRYCSYCGKPLLQGASFCGYCGRPVQENAGASQPEQPAQRQASARPEPVPHHTMTWYSIYTHFVLLLQEIGSVLGIIIYLFLAFGGSLTETSVQGSFPILMLDAAANLVQFSLASKARKSLLYFRENALGRVYLLLFLTPIFKVVTTVLNAMLDILYAAEIEASGPVLTVGYLIFCLFNVLYFEHRKDLFVND